AELLQSLCCVCGFAVDVHARSKFLCERRVFGPAPNGGDFVAKLVRELNPQVAQTADPLYSDKVARKRTAVPQRVVGGNSRAEQRGCFDVAQGLRYCHQCLDRSHHVLLISAVIADAWNFQIPAIAKISTLALAAGVVVAAVPADAGALPPAPHGNTGADF